MEKNITYRFDKKYEVLTTDGTKRNYKGREFNISGELPSYYIVLVEGEHLPILISKGDLNKAFNSSNISIVDLDMKDLKYPTPITSNELPITEVNLLKEGFEKRANMYMRGNVSVQLIQGHTWHRTDLHSKFGKDVKLISEL